LAGFLTFTGGRRDEFIIPDKDLNCDFIIDSDLHEIRLNKSDAMS
jgi:hypothetical protein